MAYFSGWGSIALTGGRDIPYFIVPIFAPIIGACLGVLGYKLFLAISCWAILLQLNKPPKACV